MGTFDNNELDRIRNSVDIAEIIGDYVGLKRKSQGDYWGQCPFHDEKTPSFHVQSDKGMYHCFGCGKGGNVFTFIMEIEGVSFPEALKMVAERAGIEIEERSFSKADNVTRNEKDLLYQVNAAAARWFNANLAGKNADREAKRALEYLENRGITPEIIRNYQLGWAPSGWDGLIKWAQRSGFNPSSLGNAGLANRKRDGSGYVDRFRSRIIFPIRNLSGKPIAFGARRVDGITPDSEEAKYVNSPETIIYHKGEHLYGMDVAREFVRKSDYVYLCEGYTDLLALVQAGVNNAAASLGTAFTPMQARLIRRFAGRVIIAYDSDIAGRNAAIRAADIIIQAGLEARMVMLPEGDDPDTVLRRSGAGLLREFLENSVSFVRFTLEIPPARTPEGGESHGGGMDMIEKARTALETIKAVKDHLQRDLLLAELSDATGLRRETLEKTLYQLKSRTGNKSQAVEKTRLIFTEETVPERDLIQALLRYPELISEVIDTLHADQIKHKELRNFFRILEETYLHGERLDSTSFPQRFDDPAMRSFIAEAVIESDFSTFDRSRLEVRGCLNAINRREIKQTIAKKEMELANARKKGEATRELMRDLFELQKQLRSI